MSIFSKDCPHCARANKADAERCVCGYRFEPEGSSDGEFALEQEALYRDYLAARIAQAETERNVALAQAQIDPDNKTKAADALLAEQALNALRAEMQQHVLKYPSLPARPVPPPPPTRPEIKQAAPPKKPVIAPPPPARKAAVMHKMAARQPAGVAKPPSRVAARPQTPVAKPAPQAAKPAPSATPSETFRNLQARKATAALRAQTAAVKPARPIPRPAEIPPIQAPAPARTPTTQECPNCTAAVPMNRERCSCGYQLSRPAQEIPGISLDAASLAILKQGIRPKGR
ncbi:MAG: hypothetical protein ACJ8LN_05090 [Sulfurifustis sp.]